MSTNYVITKQITKESNDADYNKGGNIICIGYNKTNPFSPTLIFKIIRNTNHSNFKIITYINQLNGIGNLTKNDMDKILDENTTLTLFKSELNFYEMFTDSKYVIKVKDIIYIKINPLDKNIYPAFVFPRYTCDLWQWKMYTKSGINITLEAFRTICIVLLKGLVDIHKRGVIHHDVKMMNILYNHPLKKIVYCDFGSAIKKEDVDLYKKVYLCTVVNRAPERFLELPFDERVDIYGLGCTFYFLFTGTRLFSCYNDSKDTGIMECIVERRKVNEKLNKTIDNVVLLNLLTKMLAFNKDDRPFAHECLLHLFFKKKRIGKRKRKESLIINSNKRLKV
jgi:serine/threonine protein kinase